MGMLYVVVMRDVAAHRPTLSISIEPAVCMLNKVCGYRFYGCVRWAILLFDSRPNARGIENCKLHTKTSIIDF